MTSGSPSRLSTRTVDGVEQALALLGEVDAVAKAELYRPPTAGEAVVATFFGLSGLAREREADQTAMITG